MQRSLTVRWRHLLTIALLGIVDSFAAGDADEGARLMKQADYGYLRADLPKLLTSVRGGIGRAIGIVANLRSFSYFGHGGVAEADLGKCVRSTVEIVAQSLRGRVEVHCALSGLPKVVCNAAHMNQVFLNLVSNAADAIAGPGRIDVTGRVVGDFVEIQVADTGSGIPPEVLPKIFEPFFSTKPLGEGTGLGLSISYGIIRDHGGTITAEPRPDGGTVFRVRLPLRGARA
jgi:two-component system NtrC family sensor kinase